ncbi:PIN domain-containing protein [Candidatus Electrothrix aarhusensis]
MIILDTHVWWWAISEPERLSAKAADLIRNTEKRYVASISLWEFAMMATRGRIDLAIPPYEWLRYAINEAGTKVLPLSADIALDSCNLPGNFHKDPADRMIVATARVHHAQLVTKDGKIRAYSHVHSVW